MLNISSRGFKLSIISLAILSAQNSFAQNLATITVQASDDQATQSSEQSKSILFNSPLVQLN